MEGEVFVKLGMLLVEGRHPTNSERGYKEGPHCPGPTNKPNQHHCQRDNFTCERMEKLRRHMSLLCENTLAMCIEVSLCPDCPCGADRAHSTDLAGLPSPGELLLEQWTIAIVNKRSSENPSMGRMSALLLLQAVRSQLHFSQLSAWWSSSKGTAPANIAYRLTFPGHPGRFSSQFTRPPLEHSFPLAAISPTSDIQVSVSSLPRCDLPTIVCSLHISVPSGAVPLRRAEPIRSETAMGAECLLDPPGPRRRVSPARTANPLTGMSGPVSPPRRRLAAHLLMRGSENTIEKSLSNSLGVAEDHALAPGLGEPLLLDDRMQTSCDKAGKHHCSGCEAEEELGAPATLTPPRQRRRSQEQPPLPALPPPIPLRRPPPEPAPSNIGSNAIRFVPPGLSQVMLAEGSDRSVDVEKKAAKMKFELSRREVEEVLSVLRARNGPGKAALSDSILPESDCSLSSEVSQPKGEILLSALLRTSENQQLKRKRDVFENKSDLNSCNKLMTQSLSNNLQSDSKISNNNDPLCLPNVFQINNMCSKEKDVFTNFDFGIDKRKGGLPNISNEINDASLIKYDFQLEKLTEKLKRRESPVARALFGEGKAREELKKESSESIDQLIRFTNSCDPGSTNLVNVDSNRTSEHSVFLDCFGPKQFKETNTEERTFSAESESDLGLIDSFTSMTVGSTVPATKTAEGRVPSAKEKRLFRQSLDSAASMVFHSRTGLPLTSSPAPLRRVSTRFDFDSTINSVSAIRSALFEPPSPGALSACSDDTESEGAKSPSAANLIFALAWPYHHQSASSLLGSFEESVLNGRLEPVSTVEGFTADLSASGAFCPAHLVLPVTVFFYTVGDNDKVSTPYLGHINLGKKGYVVPRSGTIQVTLLNPLGTVVKMFVVVYNLSDMPTSSHTFIRQRTLYMPAASTALDGVDQNQLKYLRYLIHLRFSSSKSGRISLHTDIRMIIFRKSDLDTATGHGLDSSYEMRSFTHGPHNPKFSPRK